MLVLPGSPHHRLNRPTQHLPVRCFTNFLTLTCPPPEEEGLHPKPTPCPLPSLPNSVTTVTTYMCTGDQAPASPCLPYPFRCHIQPTDSNLELSFKPVPSSPSPPPLPGPAHLIAPVVTVPPLNWSPCFLLAFLQQFLQMAARCS